MELEKPQISSFWHDVNISHGLYQSPLPKNEFHFQDSCNLCHTATKNLGPFLIRSLWLGMAMNKSSAPYSSILVYTRFVRWRVKKCCSVQLGFYTSRESFFWSSSCWRLGPISETTKTSLLNNSYYMAEAERIQDIGHLEHSRFTTWIERTIWAIWIIFPY